MNDFAYPWCPKCGNNFPIRQGMYNELEKCGNTFYCPLGHSLVITRESVVDRLWRAEKRVDYKSNIISKLQKHIESLRGVQTRQRNRLLRGVCPYCNLTSSNLIKHVRERHKQ